VAAVAVAESAVAAVAVAESAVARNLARRRDGGAPKQGVLFKALPHARGQRAEKPPDDLFFLFGFRFLPGSRDS
jgi:hypothetical protein